MRRPIVLTIAGHDPSGGAGVSADQRVIEAMGCIALSAVTSLTVQNTQGVRSVHPTNPSVLAAQLDALFEDCDIDAVKIGMLGGLAQVTVVADAIQRFCPSHVVLDPVLASTSGASLLDDAGIEALLDGLMPLSDVITPNLDEASRLTGRDARNIASMENAGRLLIDRGARCVVVKGGHLEGEPADVVVVGDVDCVVLSGARIATPHLHGTGCFLSAAIAAYLALGLSTMDAVRSSKEALRLALEAPVVAGKGPGYPGWIRSGDRYA